MRRAFHSANICQLDRERSSGCIDISDTSILRASPARLVLRPFQAVLFGRAPPSGFVLAGAGPLCLGLGLKGKPAPLRTFYSARPRHALNLGLVAGGQVCRCDLMVVAPLQVPVDGCHVALNPTWVESFILSGTFQCTCSSYITKHASKAIPASSGLHSDRLTSSSPWLPCRHGRGRRRAVQQSASHRPRLQNLHDLLTPWRPSNLLKQEVAGHSIRVHQHPLAWSNCHVRGVAPASG